MKSRKIILVFHLLIFQTIGCQGQDNDSTRLDKKLSEYQINPCLSILLTSVADANRKYYNADTFFYALTFKRGKNQKYLSISTDRWHDAKLLDYDGMIKVKNISFLCRGDFKEDSLFKRLDSSALRVQLQKAKDITDAIPFFIEPSLQGTYFDCQGMPIYIEVYTKGKIPAFEMKVLNSHEH